MARKHKVVALRKSRSRRANLRFPVGKIHRLMKRRLLSSRIGATASVYMAAVMEYLTAEVLELAGIAARERRKKLITPRHIQEVVRQDEELDMVFDAVIIPGGGVLVTVEKEEILELDWDTSVKNQEIQAQAEVSASHSEEFINNVTSAQKSFAKRYKIPKKTTGASSGVGENPSKILSKVP